MHSFNIWPDTEVTLMWVPAHAGVVGNDRLAKRAFRTQRLQYQDLQADGQERGNRTKSRSGSGRGE